MNTPTRDLKRLPDPTPQQKRNRKEWAAALLSGEYQQTPGNLHTVCRTAKGYTFQYCCLGVAEDLHAEGAEWILWDSLVDLTDDTPTEIDVDNYLGGNIMNIGADKMYSLHTKDGHSSGSMPPSDDFEDRYGLNEEDVEALAEANDQNATFEEIAGWLTQGAIPWKYY
jgi:hypothetical protein